ncbi:MAG: hypothetical protein MSIBF_03045 [Candidatus Altiarchaeales archaeon IMC4]|nr:MAG: hypothetical protein MSIBF_03045 [Candidatus Altiarchaeales archaeon IMC4]
MWGGGKNRFKDGLSNKFISEKIIQLLEDEKLNGEMSECSKRHVKGYKWDEIARGVEVEYERIAKDKSE